MPSRTRATGPKTNRDPTRNRARRAHGNVKRDTDTNTAGHDRRTIPNPRPKQASIAAEMSCMTPAHALWPDPRPVTRCVESIFRACYGHSIVPNYADIVHKPKTNISARPIPIEGHPGRDEGHSGRDEGHSRDEGQGTFEGQGKSENFPSPELRRPAVAGGGGGRP
jgi:hypothetical protein